MKTFEIGTFDFKRWEIFKQCGHSGTFITLFLFMYYSQKVDIY